MRIVIDLQAAQNGNYIRGIGRYAFELSKSLCKNRGEHEVLLALNGLFPKSIERIRADFSGLLPQENIHVWYALKEVSAASSENDWRRQVAELVRESFLASLNPDLVIIASICEGSVDDSVVSIGLLGKIPTAVIFYDLIPLIYPHHFLKEKRDKTWYMSKLNYMRQADLLLAISESSRQEGIRLLEFPENKIHNISAAVSSLFQPQQVDQNFKYELWNRYKICKPFLMSVATFEIRKNLEELIQAYALLPKPIRMEHQLVLVGMLDPSYEVYYQELINKAGLTEGEVVIAGYIPDRDIVNLYNLCKAFIFASFHEGFGLPILEAMSCGKAVICSNTSSMPEVIGHEGALFDPKSHHSISKKMNQVLCDDIFRKSLEIHALQQARKFSWDESAHRALKAIEKLKRAPSLIIRSEPVKRKPRLAYVSPFTSELIPVLSKFYKIDVIVKEETIPHLQASAHCKPRSVNWFLDHAQEYDRVLYHFDHSNDHQYMLSLLDKVPGVIYLTDFFHSSILNSKNQKARFSDFFGVLLYVNQGYLALRKYLSSSHHDFCYENQKTRNINDLEYYHSIEKFYQDIQINHALINRIATLDDTVKNEDSWAPLVQCITKSIIPVHTKRQLFLDVTYLAMEDAKTGIQRVSRNLLRELLEDPRNGYRVEPVYASKEKGYCYARKFAVNFMGCQFDQLTDEPIEYKNGDIFLSLDLTHVFAIKYRHFYKDMRNHGVRVYYIVFDLLPILFRDFFPSHFYDLHKAWLEIVSESDGALCISRSVANDLTEWFHKNRNDERSACKISWFHLGADMDAQFEGSASTTGMPKGSDTLLETVSNKTTFLMVGTIEPRKGYKQAIAAFERLWMRGIDVNFIIVGHKGWEDHKLFKKLRSHSENGKRLFWLEGISDEYLNKLYSTCTCLIAASEGEGFGLPLIEASKHKIPIIARDIPVFREVAGNHAYYFKGTEPQNLSEAIKKWLDLHKKGQAPSSEKMPWQTWKQSAQQIWEAINNDFPSEVVVLESEVA